MAVMSKLKITSNLYPECKHSFRRKTKRNQGDAENPDVAEQPEEFLDVDGDRLDFSEEEESSFDDFVIVPKEAPLDSDGEMVEYDGELVVEEEFTLDQDQVRRETPDRGETPEIDEMPEILVESSSYCAENGTMEPATVNSMEEPVTELNYLASTLGNGFQDSSNLVKVHNPLQSKLAGPSIVKPDYEKQGYKPEGQHSFPKDRSRLSDLWKPRKCGTYYEWQLFPFRSKIIRLLIMLLIASSQTDGATTAPILRAGQNYYDEGASVRLICISSNSVKWFWNERLLNRSLLSLLDAEEDTSDVRWSTLTVKNISSRFDGTLVQCQDEGMRSNQVTLMIIGPPTPPTNLSFDKMNSVLSWGAGHSRYNGITTYCLEIYSLTSSNVLYSICNWNETYFSMEPWSHLLVCGELGVRVIAQNSAGNSSSTTITIPHPGNNITRSFIKAEPNSTKKTLYITTARELCMNGTEVLVDGEPVGPSIVEGQRKELRITLPDNGVYSVVVQDTGNGVTMLAGRVDTYDVEETNVVSNLNGLTINSSFVNDTSAVGVLYWAILQDEGGQLDFKRTHPFVVRRKRAELASLYPLPAGDYTILTYDIERDGLIQAYGLPAVVKSVIVKGSNEEYETHGKDKFSIEFTELGASITCHCTVGHYQVVLLGNELNITRRRQECSESVYFELEYNKMYAVAVFREDDSTGVFGNSVYSQSFISMGSGSTNSDSTHSSIMEEEEDHSKIITITIVVLILFGPYLIFPFVYIAVGLVFLIVVGCIMRKQTTR